VHIEWAIACRFAEVHGSLGTLDGAGVDTFRRELPTFVEVYLGMRLLATADELGHEVAHYAISRIRDPRGDVIEESGSEFRILGESPRADWLTGFVLSTRVRFEAAEEGAYTIEQQVDGDAKSLPLHVIHEPLAA
jgi:hypothetical protein